MNVYVWRHNKTYHSHSMIDEPCINSEFYLDALAIVAATSREEAIELLCARKEGWRAEDLRALPSKVIPLDSPQALYTELRGGISHL